MALADRMKPRHQYRIDEIRDQLDDTDKATLDAWLSDRAISNAAIARALTEEGHPVGKSAVGEYRITLLQGAA